MLKGGIVGLVFCGLFAFASIGKPVEAAQMVQVTETGEDTASTVSEGLPDQGEGISKKKDDKKDETKKNVCKSRCLSTYDRCLDRCTPGNSSLNCRRSCEDAWMSCNHRCTK